MQLLIFIFTVFALTLLIGFSYSISYQACRLINFSLAIIIAVAPYFTYMYHNQFQVPFYLSIILAITSTAIVGMLIEILLYKPLRKRNASLVELTIASLGLYIVLQNVISLIWGDRALTIRTSEIVAGHEFLGAVISNTQIIKIVVCSALFIAGAFFMKYCRIGRNIRAVASNSDLSNVVGISSDKVILWAFGIGSALAGVAGLLIAIDTDMRPTMGFSWLFYGVVAMIIGGLGSIRGLIGGALLLVSVQYVIAYSFGTKWMEAVTYIILILFLIFRPLGFSGKRLKKVEI